MLVPLFRPTSSWPRATRAVLCLLVLALLWTQWLGLTHRVLHSPGLQGSATLSSRAAEATAPVGAGVLSHVLAPTGADPDCRAYDQLGLLDVLLNPPPALATVQRALERVMPVPVWAASALRRSFDARGPPQIS